MEGLTAISVAIATPEKVECACQRAALRDAPGRKNELCQFKAKSRSSSLLAVVMVAVVMLAVSVGLVALVFRCVVRCIILSRSKLSLRHLRRLEHGQ